MKLTLKCFVMWFVVFYFCHDLYAISLSTLKVWLSICTALWWNRCCTCCTIIINVAPRENNLLLHVETYIIVPMSISCFSLWTMNQFFGLSLSQIFAGNTGPNCFHLSSSAYLRVWFRNDCSVEPSERKASSLAGARDLNWASLPYNDYVCSEALLWGDIYITLYVRKTGDCSRRQRLHNVPSPRLNSMGAI